MGIYHLPHDMSQSPDMWMGLLLLSKCFRPLFEYIVYTAAADKWAAHSTHAQFAGKRRRDGPFLHVYNFPQLPAPKEGIRNSVFTESTTEKDQLLLLPLSQFTI